MKIVFYEVPFEYTAWLAQQFPGHEVVCKSEKFSEQAMPDQSADVLSMFTHSPITEAMLQQLPNLKFLATRTTGYDHIDVTACHERNIAISNVPGYGKHTVAELAFGLVLMTARHLYNAALNIKTRHDFSTVGFDGIELAGKTMGVIGTGAIGSQVIKIARGFDMQVVAHDAYPNQKLAAELGFTYTSLSGVLSTATIVSIHVPSMADTRHMINAQSLATMKPGSILINTSRGDIVDTAALLKALKSRHIVAAGLDVLEEEQAIVNNTVTDLPADRQITAQLSRELIGLPQVVVTPHLGAHTQEASRRIMDVTITNIHAFISGRPQNVV